MINYDALSESILFTSKEKLQLGSVFFLEEEQEEKYCNNGSDLLCKDVGRIFSQEKNQINPVHRPMCTQLLYGN